MSDSTLQAVRSFYEQHPYPNYPLWLPLKWSDSYLNSSYFADALCQRNFRLPLAKKQILVAGCGEALPYITRHVEPYCNHVINVDLSKNSLKRAKQRCFFSLGKQEFIQNDLIDFLSEKNQNARFHHVEAFGVLHHLASPSSFFQALTTALAPGATLRLMVYNSPARSWIHDIQKALRLLGLHFAQEQAPSQARAILKRMCERSALFPNKLAQMGGEILRNDIRLVDTFLHTHEIHWRPSQWIDQLTRNGFESLRLYDRYEELDSEKNPLWFFPKGKDLDSWADKGLFEGNIEIFARYSAVEQKNSKNHTSSHSHRTHIAWRMLHNLPKSLTTIAGEAGLSTHDCWNIWRSHLALTYQNRVEYLDPILARCPLPTAKRLARLGWILPQQVGQSSLLKSLGGPITTSKKKTDTELTRKSLKNLSFDLQDFSFPCSSKKLAQAELRLIRAVS